MKEKNTNEARRLSSQMATYHLKIKTPFKPLYRNIPPHSGLVKWRSIT